MNAITFARPAALLCALGFALAQPAFAADNAKYRRAAPPPARHAAAPQPVRHIAPPVRRAAPAPRVVAPRAPVHHWQRGHWVPLHARRPVHDWRARRLPPAPPGHQWVHAQPGYYAQVALATGLITLVVNG